MIIFIDGDAFPDRPDRARSCASSSSATPWSRSAGTRTTAIRQPHPSFCATTAGFWRELPGDWRRGHTWTNPQGKEVTDVGGNLLGLLEDAGIEWYPMLRTNKVNPHPLQFGVYEDLVYHHGGGFRLTAGGRLWRASVEDRLNATPARPAGRAPARARGSAAVSGSESTRCAATAGRSARSWRGSTSRSSS